MLYLVAIGWMYVVLMMTVAEAFAPNGTLLGAVLIFVFYGVLPLSLLLYLLGTPSRRRALRAAEAREAQQALAAGQAGGSGLERLEPDGGGHAAGDAVTPKREEA